MATALEHMTNDMAYAMAEFGELATYRSVDGIIIEDILVDFTNLQFPDDFGEHVGTNSCVIGVPVVELAMLPTGPKRGDELVRAKTSEIWTVLKVIGSDMITMQILCHNDVRLHP